jgi:hypothetical protein
MILVCQKYSEVILTVKNNHFEVYSKMQRKQALLFGILIMHHLGLIIKNEKRKRLSGDSISP